MITNIYINNDNNNNDDNNNVHKSCINHKEEEEQLAKDLHIPDKIIQENGGMFLIDFTNLEPNYDHLSRHNIDKLNRQLEETIRHRYKFLHTDATRKTPEMGDFDNKVIISSFLRCFAGPGCRMPLLFNFLNQLYFFMLLK